MQPFQFLLSSRNNFFFYYLLQQTNASHIVEIVNVEDGEEAVTLPILLIELIASQLHLALIKK